MQTQTTKYNVGYYVSKLIKIIDIFIHSKSTNFLKIENLKKCYIICHNLFR